MSDEEVQESTTEAVEETVIDESPSQSEVVSESSGEQPQAEQPQEVWSHFRSMPQFEGQDDNAIAQRLYESMQREEAASQALQQYQTIAPVAQEYMSNREQFEQWKIAQQNPQPVPQQAPPQEKPWWNPPEIRDSYKRYLTRDENGREVIDPSAPMDARVALEDYQTYRAEFAQKFLDNPQDALGPMMEKMISARTEEMLEARMQQQNDENYVVQLESDNKDWLYDEKGNVSAEGIAAQKYISDAKTMGIGGAKQRWEYATHMVERDLLLQVQQRQQQTQMQAPARPIPQAVPQAPTAEQTNMEFLRNQAMRSPSRGATAGTTNSRIPPKSMTFEERLLASAQDEGLL
jgi:hypothetical protein